MSKQQKTQGRLVAFETSGAALRRSAQEHLRKGSRLKAVELLRMSLQQEDTPETRFLLADTLYGMRCTRQAADLLYSLCMMPDPPRGVYVLLAMCLRDMGYVEGAMDALAHDLQQDPESPESDDSRIMLAELSESMEDSLSPRVMMLSIRARQAAGEENLPLARRRMRRLERVCPDRTWARERWAEMEYWLGDKAEALRILARAIRLEPQDWRCRLTLCSLLGDMGYQRAACGLLRWYEGKRGIRKPKKEILQTAAELKDWELVKSCAQTWLRSGSSCDPLLLHALAEACWHTGERERAHKLWERLVRIDPMDVRAQALYHWPLDTVEKLPTGDFPPLSAIEEAIQRVKQVAQDGQGDWKLLWPWLCWMLREPIRPLQQLALTALQGEDAQTRQILRTILVLPGIRTRIRQAAFLRLAELGEQGPFPMQVDGALAMASCSLSAEQKPRRWRWFRMLLLKEAGWHGHARELLEYAAEIWRHLTQAQRERAAGEEVYLWVKVVELGWLLAREDTEGARDVLLQLPVSHRRLDRILREIERQTCGIPEMEGEKES